MRSPQIQAADYIQDKQNYSELQVLRSAAGYYIGTLYHEENYDVSGSRDSQYFRTEKEAQLALDTKSWKQRMIP